MHTAQPISSDEAYERRYTGPAGRVDIDGDPLYYVRGRLCGATAYRRLHPAPLSPSVGNQVRDRAMTATDTSAEFPTAAGLTDRQRAIADEYGIDHAAFAARLAARGGPAPVMPSRPRATTHSDGLTDRQRAIADELGLTAEQRRRYAARLASQRGGA